MTGKKCFKCNEFKQLDQFYKHKMMADGHVNKCKECNKKDVRDNYQNKISYYQSYDKFRNQQEERKRLHVKYTLDSRKKNPEKHKARTAMSNAISSGKLIRMPCGKCGDPKSEGHHSDYSKPLDVNWLCFSCHRKEHGEKPGMSKSIFDRNRSDVTTK